MYLFNTGSGNELEGDVGDIVSQTAQTSPYFQLREKFKFRKSLLPASYWNIDKEMAFCIAL